jgi:translation initiation factor IF-2
MLAGKHHGKIKAMHDERGNAVLVAGPSTQYQGLDGGNRGISSTYLKTRRKQQAATKRSH